MYLHEYVNNKTTDILIYRESLSVSWGFFKWLESRIVVGSDYNENNGFSGFEETVNPERIASLTL